MTSSSEEIERRALELLGRLSEIDEEAREAWIDEQTGNEPQLRDRLHSLLRAERRLTLQTGGAAAGQAIEEATPARIGVYRITGLIGRGGMGAVYRGERDAGDFERAVAIKLIKPGLLSQSLIERFERERQTLAALVHPGIAQLYDGGATEDGAPYFVMELVDGRPLEQWVEERHPSLDERLRIFLKACSAVSFAHHNLIIHRDLTPSNILVNDAGDVKLIDFGIAKPADQQADAAAATVNSLASLSLTPGYAAPERQQSRHVATSADIYSLGRVLATLVAEAERDTEFAAIIAHACETEPERRYPTVEALGADVRAWRDHFPVEAYSTERGYRWRKFARRNWRGLAATGTAVALVLGAFAITGWALVQTREANRQEAERFGQVRSLAHYLIYDLNDRLSRIPGNTAARANLAEQAQRYFELLDASPSKPADLQLEIARGLTRLARIQGDPLEPNLGQFERSEQNLDRALVLLAPFDRQAETVPDRASAMAYKAMLALHSGSREEEAGRHLASAGKLLEGAPAAARGESWYRSRRQWRLAQLEFADLANHPGDIAGIASSLMADHADWPAVMRQGSLPALDAALAAHYRALGLAYDDKPGALPLFQEADRGFEGLLAKAPNDPLLLYRSASNAYEGFAEASRQVEDREADRLIDRASDTVTRLMAVDPDDNAIVSLAANIEEARAQSLRDKGRFADAIALEKEVVAGRRLAARRTGGAGEKGDLGFSLMVLGVIARDGGERTMACASWTESLDLLAAQQRAGEIIGFHESFIAGLKAKQAACVSGTSIDTPMR